MKLTTAAISLAGPERSAVDQARELLERVTAAAREVASFRETQPAVYYAGYVEDAQKEDVEASSVLAIAQGKVPPGPDELGVGPAPYLNGLADVAGELRRYILDSLRRDDFTRCEELLGYTLNSIHNLRFLLQLMEDIRSAIDEGKFAEFRQSFIAGFEVRDHEVRMRNREARLENVRRRKD